MIQDFSQGYYHLSMDVEVYDDGPMIGEPLHRFIQTNIFTQESPVIMRVGLDTGPTFGVTPESGVPEGLLGLPRELVDERGPSDVFVLKPEYVDVVGDYDG